ncbi:hypothetical protein ACJJTC_002487 [Scirpophaga incertulas]
MKPLYLVLVLSVCIVKASEVRNIEGRGKAKYALLMHFFYVAATKLVVLKIVYSIIFFVLISKAWHFLLWFTEYIKHKKNYVEYIEHEPTHHGYHEQGHHDYRHLGFDDHGFVTGYHRQESPYHGYEEPYYGYGYGKSEYIDKYGAGNKNFFYDSDGSYSVKDSQL